MPERFCGEIQIGGVLKKAHIDLFLKELKNTGASLEFGNCLFAPETIEELMEEVTAARTGFLYLKDAEAVGGEFEELEMICRRIGLSYARYSDGYGEFNAEVSWYQPGMAKQAYALTLQSSHNVVVTAEALQEVIKHLKVHRGPLALRILTQLIEGPLPVPPLTIEV